MAPYRHRKRLQLFSRAALVRLFVLAIALCICGIGLWRTLLWMPEQSYRGELPALTAQEVMLKDALQDNISYLGGELKQRNYGSYDNLLRAEAYITAAFTEAGYLVQRQEYQVDGKTYANLIGERRGTMRPEEIMVVGGHYDSAYTSPGANDNGSGVAATIALAREFANRQPARTLRFVAFVNEEPPFFWTENMGSFVYAKQCREQGDAIVAMLSLETLGYYSDEPNSQHYPFPLNLWYPHKGNFVAFVGNVASRQWVREIIGTFRQRVQFPSEGAALPDWIPGVGWSDHWSFWQQHYPALMVTDTAPFRYVHYHTDTDTPEQIDYDRLARVVSGLGQVIQAIAG